MRILHINTADSLGGAARAAYRLHSGLLLFGVDSKILARYKVTADPDVLSVHKDRYYKLLDRITYPFIELLGFQDIFYPSSLSWLNSDWMKSADIIQLHNLHGRFFPFPFLKLLRSKPLVWYLHDMWPLTGHCCYSYECDKWKTYCNRCPIRKEDYLPLKYDTTSIHHRLKLYIYNNLNLNIVAPSKWLAGIAKGSSTFKHFPISHIPYGIDCDFFSPLDKKTSKDVLGFGRNKLCILFSAHILDNNPRKGANFFLSALNNIAASLRKNLKVILMGESYSYSLAVPNVDFTYIGYITNDYLLRIVLSASDLLVMPSLADNLPLSIMESMACATPPIAFDAGGISDMVRHMKNGYLAKYKDVDDLANGLRLLLEDDALRLQMGKRCREIVETEYSLRLQAERFKELYERILSK